MAKSRERVIQYTALDLKGRIVDQLPFKAISTIPIDQPNPIKLEVALVKPVPAGEKRCLVAATFTPDKDGYFGPDPEGFLKLISPVRFEASEYGKLIALRGLPADIVRAKYQNPEFRGTYSRFVEFAEYFARQGYEPRAVKIWLTASRDLNPNEEGTSLSGDTTLDLAYAGGVGLVRLRTGEKMSERSSQVMNNWFSGLGMRLTQGRIEEVSSTDVNRFIFQTQSSLRP